MTILQVSMAGLIAEAALKSMMFGISWRRLGAHRSVTDFHFIRLTARLSLAAPEMTSLMRTATLRTASSTEEQEMTWRTSLDKAILSFSADLGVIVCLRWILQ